MMIINLTIKYFESTLDKHWFLHWLISDVINLIDKNFVSINLSYFSLRDLKLNRNVKIYASFFWLLLFISLLPFFLYAFSVNETFIKKIKFHNLIFLQEPELVNWQVAVDFSECLPSLLQFKSSVLYFELIDYIIPSFSHSSIRHFHHFKTLSFLTKLTE